MKGTSAAAAGSDRRSINRIIGQNIKSRRVEQGLKQQEMALMLGISNRSMQRIEAGTVAVSADVLARIASFQRKLVEWYLTDRGTERRRVRG